MSLQLEPAPRPAGGRDADDDVAPSLAGYPSHRAHLPTKTADAGRYRVRFAQDDQDLDRILRLRFEVFNLELGEGLDASFATRRDRDRFDGCCHHLLVEDRHTGEMVGTYRVQTTEMARRGEGLYAAGEFDLGALPEGILDDAIEAGRACIRRDHRNRQVLFLLWRGLAIYVQATGKRYFFGCSSLTSQNPEEGARLYSQLEADGLVRQDFTVPPLPDLRCEPRAAGGTGDPPEAAPPVELPALFRTYLRYGAKVCSPPAIDRDFKTIDFLVLLDTLELSERSRRLFFDGG
ncbi:MAG TPA: GNAT family N-acyltransferase [Thermoanaerobaculia bacterium]|nr:GNAT family N-acyltransferase [Thermoanaerobaculia bacterium]